MEIIQVSRELAVRSIQEAIVEKGSVLGGGILKVDSFLNHQKDPRLIKMAGNLICDTSRTRR
jgi:xanthine phosphoribosyltransferase